MKTSNPYLYFDGNCREAMTFYRDVFGAEGGFTTFADMPPDAQPKGAPAEGIMHCELHVPGLTLMAGDIAPGASRSRGESMVISVTCDSVEEMDRLFARLGAGGVVTDPVHDTFWGDRMGMLADQFGVHWMLSFR